MRTVACSLAMCGLTWTTDSPSGRLAAAIALARACGCAAMQLDGAMNGLRARQLDRSARRDIAAQLRRNGLGFSGIDLWVPAPHFAASDRVDAAVAAVKDACRLAGDLAGLTGFTAPRVCIDLPNDPPAAVCLEIASASAAAGTRLADAGGGKVEQLGVCVDPAREIVAGRDVLERIGQLGPRVEDARLTDANRLGRCEPGRGLLDVRAYRAVLETVTAVGFVVIDTRGLATPGDAAAAACSAWGEVL